MLQNFRLLPDIRPAVYCTAIRNGPPSFFGSLLNLFTEQFATNIYFYQEYQQLLNGLSCATDSIDIQNYLSLVLKQPQLVASGALGYLKNNPNAPVIMYQYLILHCNNVFATASNWDPYLDAMTYAWFSQDKVDSMIQLNNTVTNIAFNCTLSTDQLTRLQAYIQRVQTQAQWTNLYAADPIRWLYNNLVPQGKVPWPDRLPTNLAPTSYQLQVQPYFPSSVTYPWYKEYTFDGQVTINFTVLQTTNTIVLNAHRMIIDPNNIVLTSAGTGTQFPINRNQVSKNYQTAFLTIPVVGTLTAGSNYTLTISPYTGFIFSDSSEGVYINTNFFEFNGQKALIFATDFEGGPSTRSIAPCFDEPSYKATWSTTVQHPKDMVALSNGYETSFTFPGGNWQITTFATMPPMSSYLVAIAVGHLTALQQNDQSGTLVRLWSWTGMEQYAVFDLTVASGTLDFMGNYFNFTFPLAKA
uniref:Aminopeptidase N-like N-terminal domain-containing protein n=1 Tax=Plectus sambesii TaxID=2011161 RepID=A0A914XM14_9BILA